MSELATYQTAFAPRDGEPLFPELWKDCVFAANPGLGPSGLTLRDWSGRGNHGTLTNGPTWGPVGGRQCLSFDGVDEHAYIGPVTSLSVGANESASVWAWIRTTQTTRGDIYSRYNGVSLGIFGLHIGSVTSGKISVFLRNDSGAGLCFATSSQSVNDGGWHHVGMQRNKANGKLEVWIDGRKDGETNDLTGADSISTGGAAIGRSGDQSAAYFSGAIAEVSFFRRSVVSSGLAKLMATRHGIAYELAPQRYAGETAASFNARLLARRNQILGGGL